MNHQELRERGVYHLNGRDFIACAGDDGGYVLYTKTEWETEATADFEIQPDGRIAFQGEPTPHTITDLIDTGRDIA